MADDHQRLRELFRQYLENRIEAADYDLLWKMLERSQHRNVLPEELQSLWEASINAPAVVSKEVWDEKMQQAMVAKDNPSTEPLKAQKKKKRYSWQIAAAITLLLSFGLYYFRGDVFKEDARRTATTEQQDILPGRDKAVLTLADGSRITLDSVSRGVPAFQGASEIKLTAGLLAYHSKKSEKQQRVYNTLTTPRGGKFRLTLADGSKVWLNAASSITFPTSFGEGNRTVSVTGEAYFEIAHDASKPFEVIAGDTQVEVLGTHFNIMAYPDEKVIETTLLEGAVKVTQGNAEVLLKPGQQARVDDKGTVNLIPDVVAEQVIAWKNELFWFDKTDIGSVTRQLSRWYNVDVEIRGTISHHFSGTLPRNEKVSRIFEVLEETGGIQFTIEDKKIVVSP